MHLVERPGVRTPVPLGAGGAGTAFHFFGSVAGCPGDEITLGADVLNRLLVRHCGTVSFVCLNRVVAFRSEISGDSPNGRSVLRPPTIGFTPHLLSAYAVARPTIVLPRGKLNGFQLRSVVDFIPARARETASTAQLYLSGRFAWSSASRSSVVPDLFFLFGGVANKD
jgi:hypothetical protein